MYRETSRTVYICHRTPVTHGTRWTFHKDVANVVTFYVWRILTPGSLQPSNHKRKV